MLEWMRLNGDLLGWLAALSAVVFVASLIAIPILVARIPADYFVRENRPNSVWRNPYMALVSLVLKNAVGIALVSAGIAMLVMPGQGVLTILIGMTLMNFPGKRALELAIVRQRAVLCSINWIRTKAHRAPLELPPPRPRI